MEAVCNLTVPTAQLGVACMLSKVQDFISGVCTAIFYRSWSISL